MTKMNQIVEQKPEERVSSRTKANIYGLFLSSCGLFYGYGLGLFNNFFGEFMKTFGITDPDRKAQIQQNFNMFFISGITIACVISPFIYETMGRYKSMLFAFALEIIVCLGMLNHSIKVYYIIRILAGFVGYFWTFLAPLMMTENLPPSIDKSFNPFMTGMISFGIIAGYLFFSPGIGAYWRLIALSPLVTEVPKLVYFLYMRMESPLWMAQQGANVAQLKENYLYLYDEQVADELANKMKAQSEEEPAVPFKSIFKAEYRTQLLIVFLLNMLNQLTGGGLLELYSTNIFTEATLPYPHILTIMLGVVSLIAGAFVFRVSPVLGLRNMLITGLAGQAFFYFVYIAGAAFELKAFVAIGIFLSYFAYCISLGGVLFSYNSKLLPASGITLGAFFQNILSSFLAGYAEDLRVRLGAPIMFFIMQLCATFGGILFMGYSVDIEDKEKNDVKAEFQNKTFFS